MANDLAPFQATPPPTLVDGNGRPLRSATSDLTREIAGPTLAGTRSIYSGHPAQGLTPARLANILRQAETGNAMAYLELAEEMEEKDLHYQSVMGTRKRAVSQLPVRVEPASEDPQDQGDAEIVRTWLKRLTLQSELFDILDAVGKGYSATEIIWELGELWLPALLKRQDPRFFEFDQVSGEQLLLRDVGMPQPLPDWKFIVHLHPAKSGLPIRGGIARAAAWGYLFKNFTIKDWMAFLEVYGLPLRVGKYQNGATEADIRKLADAVAQIGSDAGAVIPQSMMLEFITTSGGSGNSADMFERKCRYIDEQLSKAVLGQTSSSDAKAGGLGSGQADLHGEVREDIETADAVLLSASLTRDLARPMVMFNRGMRQRYPMIIVGRPKKIDVEAALKSIEAGVKLGVPIAISTFRELTGIPEPKDGEDLLTALKESPPQGPPGDGSGSVPPEKGPPSLLGALKREQRANGKQVSAAISDPPRDPDGIGAISGRSLDGIDRAIDEHLDDWEKLIAPALAPVEAMIAGATSLEQVRDLLAGTIASMDIDAVAALMEKAGFGARLAGQLETGS